jgi:transposase
VRTVAAPPGSSLHVSSAPGQPASTLGKGPPRWATFCIRSLPYKGRNVVELCINRLKDFRAVAMRFDKRGHHYLAQVILAATLIWLG